MSRHVKQWVQAMEEELNSIRANEAWKLVPLPTG